MEPTLGIDGVPGEAGPDGGHPLHAGPGRITGEGHAVHRPDRAAVDPVGDEAVLGEHLQHADLYGTPGAATRQDQGGDGPASLLLAAFLVPVVDRPAARLGLQPTGPGHRGPLQGEPHHQDQQHQRGHDEHREHHGERQVGGRDRHQAKGYRWDRATPAGAV